MKNEIKPDIMQSITQSISRLERATKNRKPPTILHGRLEELKKVKETLETDLLSFQTALRFNPAEVGNASHKLRCRYGYTHPQMCKIAEGAGVGAAEFDEMLADSEADSDKVDYSF